MRFKKSAYGMGITSLLIAAALTACGSGPQIFGQAFVADSGLIPFSVRQANAQNADAPSGGGFEESELRQRLLVSTRPPKIIVSALEEVPDALGFAARVTARKPSLERGQRWSEAAQIGLLFGSPEGKAFLSAREGRALVRGEPAESCPNIEMRAAPTPEAATQQALEACLAALSLRDECSCRVIAQGEHLLAPRDEFAYAIGISTTVLAPSKQVERTLTSEERPIEGRDNARHVWVLGVDAQPYALLQVEDDGRAALVIWKGRESFTGTHREDGFRRGRMLRRAYLTNEAGERMIILVGYEDQELKDNLTTLTAWNPDGVVELVETEED